MTGEEELKRRAIERLHARHARHGLTEAVKPPASWEERLFVLLLAGLLAVTLLTSVLMRAIGG